MESPVDIPVPPVPARRERLARYASGYAVVVAALPYLIIKIVWLSGHPLGVRNMAVVNDGVLATLNVLTAGLDLAAILLALAFTHSWGSRLPSWLVLPPLWAGTGLLAPIVIMFPLTMTVMLLRGEAFADDGLVDSWVYAMVYTGFTVEGLGLGISFLLYARSRWRSAFIGAVGDRSPLTSYRIQPAVFWAVSTLATTVGLAFLAWGLGMPLGVFQETSDELTFSGHILYLVWGCFALASVAGLLAVAGRWGRGMPRWLALTLTWSGTASLFCWGGWVTLGTLTASAIAEDTAGIAVYHVVQLGALIAGTAMGAIGALSLPEWISDGDGAWDGTDRSSVPHC